MTHDELMDRVLELAMEARTHGDHPFGALLALDDEIVAEALNLVNTDHDITAHAELTLVRRLERSGQLEALAAGTVYASCEPCPMCVGALFWAGARRVVYALSKDRLNELASPHVAEPHGFGIGATEIGARAVPPMTLDGPQREEDAERAHLDFWS